MSKGRQHPRYEPPSIPREALDRPVASGAVQRLVNRGVLTDRERFVIAMHHAGATARDIADGLGLSGHQGVKRARTIRVRVFAKVITEIRAQKIREKFESGEWAQEDVDRAQYRLVRARWRV